MMQSDSRTLSGESEEITALSEWDRCLLSVTFAWGSQDTLPGPVFQDLVRREKRKPWWRYLLLQSLLVVVSYALVHRLSGFAMAGTLWLIVLGAYVLVAVRAYGFVQRLIGSGTLFHLLLTPLRLRDIVRDMRLAVCWLVARDCGFVIPILGLLFRSLELIFFGIGFIQLPIFLAIIICSGALSSPTVFTKFTAAVLAVIILPGLCALVLPLEGVLIVGSFVLIVSVMLITTHMQYEVIARLDENIQHSAVNLARNEARLD